MNQTNPLHALFKNLKMENLQDGSQELQYKHEPQRQGVPPLQVSDKVPL